MLTTVQGHSVRLTKNADNTSFVGTITKSDNPMITIDFDHDVSLLKGDSVTCEIGNGTSFAAFDGSVVESSGRQAKVWAVVQKLSAGTDRAPRALASGVDLDILVNDEVYAASLCNCSESGLKVSSLVNLSVGKIVIFKIHFAATDILLQGRIVWAKQAVNSDYVEMGVQITEADRIHRARWNHLVATFMKKFGVAA